MPDAIRSLAPNSGLLMDQPIEHSGSVNGAIVSPVENSRSTPPLQVPTTPPVKDEPRKTTRVVLKKKGPDVVSKKKGPDIVSVGCVGLDADSVKHVKKVLRSVKGGNFVESSSKQYPSHVVLGSCDPSSALALAVASGAFLLKMEWMIKSENKGCWLPEDRFEANKKLCEISRAILHKQLEKPLDRVLASVQRRANDWAKVDILDKLLVKLGATIVPIRSCAICVVFDGQQRPTSLAPFAKVVTVDWLVSVGLEYKVPHEFWQ